jgi:hypothetical protein
MIDTIRPFTTIAEREYSLAPIIPETNWEMQYVSRRETYSAYFADYSDPTNATLASVEITNSRGEKRWINYKLVGAAPTGVTVDGEMITFVNCMDGVDLQYHVTPWGLKENIIIKKSGTPISFTFSLKMDGVVAKHNPLAKDIEFLDADTNELLWKIATPSAIDAAGYELDGIRYEMGKVTLNNTEYDTVAMNFYDMLWFSEIAQYPVSLDPTTIIITSYPDFYTGDSKQSNYAVLSNGWAVIGAGNALYVTKNNGASWSRLCYFTGAYFRGQENNTSAVTAYGTMVTVAYTVSGNLKCCTFDATTVQDVDKDSSATIIHTSSYYGSNVFAGCLASGKRIIVVQAYINSSYDGLFCFTSTDGVNWSSNSWFSWNRANGYSCDKVGFRVVGETATVVAQYDYWNGSNHTYTPKSWYFSSTTFTNGGNFDTSAGTNCRDMPQSFTQDPFNGRIWMIYWHDTSVGNGEYRLKYTTGYGDWTYVTTSSSDYIPITALSIGKVAKIFAKSVGGSGAPYAIFKKESTDAITWGTDVQISDSMSEVLGEPKAFMIGSAALIAYYSISGSGYTRLGACSILYNTNPTAPTGLTRANFDATEASALTWTFNDPDAGNSQSAYQLQIIRVSDGVAVVDTGKVASITSSYTLTAGTLENNKQYQWKVKCWDNSDAVGPYSDLATFYTSAKPTVTITTPALDGATVSGPSLTTTWSMSDPESEGQGAYQVKFTSSADAVLWDSGKITAADVRAKLIDYTLANSISYKVKVTVWDPKGIASAEAVRTFVTSFTPPPVPTFITAADMERACITLTITNPAPGAGEPAVSYNDIYRDGVRIATNMPGTFTDYSVASGQTYTYKVIAIAANGTLSQSIDKAVSVTFKYARLELVSDHSQWIKLMLDPERSEKRQSERTMMRFAGRTAPVAEFGESTEINIDCQYTITSLLELNKLRSIIDANQIMLYRDSRGRKEYVTTDSLDIDDRFRPEKYSVKFTLERTSYSEVV